jgi:hypothetical protein
MALRWQATITDVEAAGLTAMRITTDRYLSAYLPPSSQYW